MNSIALRSIHILTTVVLRYCSALNSCSHLKCNIANLLPVFSSYYVIYYNLFSSTDFYSFEYFNRLLIDNQLATCLSIVLWAIAGYNILASIW